MALERCNIAGRTTATSCGPKTSLASSQAARTDAEHRTHLCGRRDEISPEFDAVSRVVDKVRASLEDHTQWEGMLLGFWGLLRWQRSLWFHVRFDANGLRWIGSVI
jgi:hypothetical protein